MLGIDGVLYWLRRFDAEWTWIVDYTFGSYLDSATTLKKFRWCDARNEVKQALMARSPETLE
jgi:hypothetical protein